MLSNRFGKPQIFILVLLRMAIGWHFLYEGVSKLLTGDWTSAGYLENADWLLANFFHWIAGSPDVLRVVDLLNMWGLTLIGLALLLGCLTRTAGVCGILLTALYYIANPPFIVSGLGVPVEGHYLIVNKNLIEIIALALIVLFPAGKYGALDTVLAARLKRKAPKATRNTPSAEPEHPEALPGGLSRRQLLASLVPLPVLAVFGFLVRKKHRWNKVCDRRLAITRHLAIDFSIP